MIHARDRYLFLDDVLLPVFESFRSQVHFERVFVIPLAESEPTKAYESYEDLLAAADDDFVYPSLDENEAAAMCFASGTTGKSKGVVYSHRALVLPWSHLDAKSIRAGGKCHDRFGLCAAVRQCRSHCFAGLIGLEFRSRNSGA